MAQHVVNFRSQQLMFIWIYMIWVLLNGQTLTYVYSITQIIVLERALAQQSCHIWHLWVDKKRYNSKVDRTTEFDKK